MPITLTTKVTNVAREPFEKLRLPSFEQTEYNDHDPCYSTRAGQDSSHRTLTMPPGLNEWHHRDKRLMGPYPNIIEVKGAIIYCQGIIEKNNARSFASTTIAGIEATLHAQDPPCPIPSLIGLPIWMRTHKHDPAINRANPMATWLHIIGDLDAEGFGFAAKSVLDSAVVMRKDGKELIPRHLEVLCFFCKHVLEEVFEDEAGKVGLSDDPYVRGVQEKTFQKLACRKGFLEFYDSYCLERGAEDARWRNLPSPYDMDDLDDGASFCTEGIRQSVETFTSVMPWATGRRTSGRITRSTQKVLESAESSSPMVRDEVSGRARKRRHSTGEE